MSRSYKKTPIRKAWNVKSTKYDKNVCNKKFRHKTKQLLQRRFQEIEPYKYDLIYVDDTYYEVWFEYGNWSDYKFPDTLPILNDVAPFWIDNPFIGKYYFGNEKYEHIGRPNSYHYYYTIHTKFRIFYKKPCTMEEEYKNRLKNYYSKMRK